MERRWPWILRTVRLAHGVTLAEAAARTGFDLSSISYWERGERLTPTEDQVHSLLEAYGATREEREPVWEAFFGRDVGRLVDLDLDPW